MLGLYLFRGLSKKMTRYWFEFEISRSDIEKFPAYCGLGWGCGVTANNLDDAREILQSRIFRDNPFPKIKRVIEGIDVSTLDSNHVLPNIGLVPVRGVWFPNLG
jgi:hypothetical protein